MDTSAVINVNVQSNDTPQAQYKTVILKPNMVDDVNTLTQAMLTVHGQNTKFVIKYDYTLGEDITVPANCVLEFDGGSLSGAYTLTGANTGIETGLTKIFNTNVTLAGTWNVAEAYPEWFGAVGNDGVKDDNAIQALVNNTSFNIKLLEKQYYITHTIYVDVQKRWLRGLSGRSIIVVQQTPDDDSAVVFHGSGGTNNWSGRGNRVQEHGYFQILCQNHCGGVRLGAKAGTANIEGMVDENNLRCITVWDGNWGMIIGSHVYKCIIDDFVNERCTLSLTYDNNSSDNGECLTFNNCAFWDSGEVRVGCQTVFNQCTFHTSVKIEGTGAHISFNSCHFEFISGAGTSESPLQYLIYNNSLSVVEINDADCPGSGQPIYLNSLFKTNTHYASIITVNGGDWEWFISNIVITSGHTLCEGNVYLNGICMQYGFAGYFKPTQVYNKNYIPNIDDTIEDPYKLKIIPYASCPNTPTISNKQDDSGIEIACSGSYMAGPFDIKKTYRIPNGKKTVKYDIQGTFENLDWIQQGDDCGIVFYNIEGKEVANLNHYNQQSSSPFRINDYFAIPYDAVYFQIRMMAFAATTSFVIDINKWAVEFL